MKYKEIKNHLMALQDNDIAKSSMRFFKTKKGEYGYGDKFLGIRVGEIRKTVKKFKDIKLTDAKKLIKSPYHEIRLFALLLLVYLFEKADQEEQSLIYQIYLENLSYVNNWDLVDLSAHYIVGRYLENREKDILYKMVKSKDLWERRIAVISTFHFIRINRFGDTFKLAKQLFCDKQDLIHKAVGWMLREIGKRDLQEELKFLKKYYKKMPRTMLRYAIERFDEPLRQSYLKGTV